MPDASERFYKTEYYMTKYLETACKLLKLSPNSFCAHTTRKQFEEFVEKSKKIEEDFEGINL